MELKPGDFVLYVVKLDEKKAKDGTLIPELLFRIGKIGELEGNIITIEDGEKIDHRAVKCKFQEGAQLDYPDFDIQFIATGEPISEKAKEFLRKCKEKGEGA